jgi:ABC-type multidrug transport system fused ATPase/permease subunit
MTKKEESQVTLAEEKGQISLWSSNFLSNWFFVWVFPIVGKARLDSLSKLKLKLRKHESARLNVDELDKAWRKELRDHPENPNIYNALKSVFGTEYWSIAAYKLLWSFFTWAGAWYLLKKMLEFLSRGGANDPDLNGHMYAMALFLAGFFSSIAIHQQYAECNRMGVKVKSAVMGLVYRKSLRLSRVKGGAGEVINILTGDVGRINDAVVNFHFLWSAFVEVSIILAISLYEIRLSALPAVGWVIILLPIQMYLGKRTDNLGRAQSGRTTERVHLMSELLTAIKLIKFYAWELPFAKKIEEIRMAEMSYVYDGLINKAINYMVVFSIPVLVALSSLGMYVGLGNRLTASVSFSVLSVFNTLRYPFFMLPMAVKSTVGALAAFDRINKFLQLEEVVELKPTTPPAGCDLALEMENCDFKWDGTEGKEPTIFNISLKLKKKAKVAIVGDVGCGKSSLIAALLGQIRQVRGDTVKVYGSTAYMSQEAWLLNMTLRENVLFGKPMDTARYREVIRVAGLQRDLTLLIAGDQTEIAERGANLSGGQRQRVSLARSVYYDADIVLMDDPLSAVDQHVGRHIFEECFMKHLKEKTLIVAINQLQYLCEFDHIVFVQDGTIYAQGNYEEMMANCERFNILVSSHVADGEAAEEEDDLGAEPMNVPNFDPEKPPKSPSPTSPISIKDLMEKNSLSVLSKNQLSVRNARDINENTIRSLIELNNNTKIRGAERDHDVAQAIMRNEVSRYSVKETLQEAEPEVDEEELIKKGKLVQEDQSTKTAGAADFVAYAQAGSGPVMTFLVVFSFIAVHGIRISGDYWLRMWVPRVGGFSDGVYIGVYGAFTFAFALGALGRGIFFTNVTSYKAKTLHDKLFDAAIHAPMSFFDTTPIARILACFSKHQLHVDDTMLDAAMQALQYFPLGCGALILCSVLITWNWAPSLGIVLVGYGLIRLTNPSDIATKSLEAITKPPVYSHLTATLEGLLSIRSYHAEKRFDDLNLEKLDTNHSSLFAMQNGIRF